jgi:restriction endonuclease S subunit
VAAGSLFILRPDPSRVIADYLVFFLNLPATQAVLRQLATGSTIPNLRRSAIEQLAMPLPSLSDQHKLVALSRLVRQQADIETRLNALRRQELHLLAAARAGAESGPASKSGAAKAVRSSDNTISQR